MYIDVKKNLWFVGSDSRKSVLDLYLPKNEEKHPLIIFLHGFKGFKDWGHFPLIFEEFAKNGIGVLSFNFSHNGGTVEEPIDFPDLDAFSDNTYSKELNDVSEILNWVSKHKSVYFKFIDLKRISILGHSRGGGIALLAAKKSFRFKSAITWAGVSDYVSRLPEEEELKKWKESGKHFIKNSRTDQEMPIKYSFVEDLLENEEKLSIQKTVESLNKPQLIIHGVNDETVKVEEAEQLKNWNPKAKLILIEDANHTFNGNHPFTVNTLPAVTLKAIQETVKFLKP